MNNLDALNDAVVVDFWPYVPCSLANGTSELGRRRVWPLAHLRWNVTGEYRFCAKLTLEELLPALTITSEKDDTVTYNGTLYANVR